MKHIVVGLGLTLLATPAFAIDAWPQCNSPERNAKTLWACNQVIGHGWMANTTAALAYENRAQTHLTLGHFDSAIADATNALKLLPEPGKESDEDKKLVNMAASVRVQSFATRAGAYRKKSENALADADETQALALAEQMIAANPVYQYYNLRAWSYNEMGKPADGLPDATKAVEISEAKPAPYSHRARIEEALGRKDEAVADYRAALKLLMALKQPDQFETTQIWFNTQSLQRLGEKP
jgi:tetratricopeptide (TPR) repeat protein